MKTPILCTLTAEEAPDRVDEWRALLSGGRVSRGPAGTAQVRFAPDDEVLLRVADLARREKACCGFFEFRLEPLPDELVLHVAAPAEAEPLLRALFGGS